MHRKSHIYSTNNSLVSTIHTSTESKAEVAAVKVTVSNNSIYMSMCHRINSNIGIGSSNIGIGTHHGQQYIIGRAHLRDAPTRKTNSK